MFETLLNNPFVQGVLVAGFGWLGAKIWGEKKDSTAAKVTSALATSAALMMQLVLTADHDMTAARMIIQCKGVIAIQFAKVGIYEAARKPHQPMIDAAIATAVTRWLETHPTPRAVVLPIAAKAI